MEREEKRSACNDILFGTPKSVYRQDAMRR